jgi:hypothetical protein
VERAGRCREGAGRKDTKLACFPFSQPRHARARESEPDRQAGDRVTSKLYELHCVQRYVRTQAAERRMLRFSPLLLNIVYSCPPATTKLSTPSTNPFSFSFSFHRAIISLQSAHHHRCVSASLESAGRICDHCFETVLATSRKREEREYGQASRRCSAAPQACRPFPVLPFQRRRTTASGALSRQWIDVGMK